MTKKRLPPLPPVHTLPHYFPGKVFRAAPKHRVERLYTQRSTLVNPRLADEFVRAIGIRDGEVIVEPYGGMGGITRSLLSQGKSASSREQLENKVAWWNELKDKAPRTPAKAKKPIVPDLYPSWIETFKDAEAELEAFEDKSEDNAKPVGKIKHISVAEPNTAIRELTYGPHPLLKSYSHAHWEWVMQRGPQAEQDWQDGVIVCPSDDRVSTTGADPYTWETVPYMLSHPKVAEHIPIVDPTAPPGPAQHQRKWTDPEPLITYVASVPLSRLGDTILGQWVASAAGAAEGYPTWIWKWGRIRMALLVSKWFYDRLTAKPGEMSRNKLSVMAEALYHVTPLPPYHHVPNVDRASNATEAVPLSAKQRTAVGIQTAMSYRDMELPRTQVQWDDAFPVFGAKDRIYKRPPVLGVMLTPRLDTPVTAAQATEWDYVLRHMFVLQASTVEAALPTLGFNAASLINDIVREDNVFAGAPVSPDTTVRDLTVDQWARVVDAFASWPFKPEDLIINATLGEGDAWDPFTD